MNNEDEWDWVELTHGAKRNGYRLQHRASYTLLFAENVWYQEARLRDGDYFVSAFLEDEEDPEKDKLPFVDGSSTKGLNVGYDVDSSQIRKAGVSIPPDY
jgi:hypothetical protein